MGCHILKKFNFETTPDILQLKTSQHNHSMSNFGLFFFFRPNELNFCVWSPIAQKITALYLFPLVCTSFLSKNVCKKQAAMGLISLFGKTKGFFCLSFNNRLQKALPSVFAYVLTGKQSTNQWKKIQGCDFLLNRRPHAKIQLIWTKKNQTKIRHRMVMRGVSLWKVKNVEFY